MLSSEFMNHDKILARRATLLELEADLQRCAICDSLASVRVTPLSSYVVAGLGMVVTRWLPSLFLKRTGALGTLWLAYKMFRRLRRGRSAPPAERPTRA